LLEDQEEELPGATQDLGAQRLKDFDRPIQIFQIVVPGLQESFPPLRTLDHTPFEGDEGRLADAARASKPEREATDTVRVLIADDQALVRAGFRMILEAEQDIEVVGEATDGGVALDEVRRVAPDVVLMDVRMPDLDGIEATRQLMSDPSVSAKVVMLTTFDMDEYVYEVLQAGASGFLLKDVPPEQLVDGIRAVASGDALLAPSITKRVIEEFVRRPPESPWRLGTKTSVAP
jgi:DNA-binding NarL/FixJ family response regulator